MKYFFPGLIVLLIFSCKKYEQGGDSRQFRKKMEGTYAIDLFLMWNQDSTHWARRISNDRVEISFHEKEGRKAQEYYIREGIEGAFFITGKKEILYSYSDTSDFNKSILQGQPYWDIIKLTDAEFWIRSSNKFITIKLKKE